jgi:hypothetical protein
VDNKTDSTMISQLIQKRGFSRQKFILYPDKIVVESKTQRLIDKYEVDIGLLGFNKHYQAENTKPGKVVFAIFLIIPIVLWADFFIRHDVALDQVIFCTVCFGFLNLMGYLNKNKDDIYLTGGKKNLCFYRGSPDEATVLAFIDLVMATTKKHFITLYTKFDDTTHEIVYKTQLMWLKNKQFITDSEFEEFLEDFRIQRLLGN